MLYLVWLEQLGRRDLVGAWPSEELAKKQCRDDAVRHSAGSGIVCESMMGDEFTAVDRERKLYRLTIQAESFGRFEHRN